MTISGYSNTIVDVMLGWLKGLANWVLRLFNLAGSVTSSPLLWLSQNWLKLLIVFLTLGVVLDRLIWLIRWRPYWVWFKKERVIVNDDRFFASADMDRATSSEKDLVDNWDEHDYVVASTVVRRQNGVKQRGAVVKNGKRPRAGADPARTRRREGTKVARRTARDGAASGGAAAKRAEGRRESARNRPSERETAHDNIFAVKLNRPDVSDFYEDEVFNVANLPSPAEPGEKPRTGKRG